MPSRAVFNLLLFAFALLNFNVIDAQTSLEQPHKVSKPPLDSSAILNWITIGNDCLINNTGDFVCYQLFKPGGVPFKLILTNIKDTSKKKEFTNARHVCFSFDGTRLVLKKLDTVVVYNIVTGLSDSIFNVSSVSSNSLNADWFVCKIRNGDNELLFVDLKSSFRRRWKNIISFQSSAIGNTLAFVTTDESQSSSDQFVFWFDCVRHRRDQIFRTRLSHLKNLNFSRTGRELVFTSSSPTSREIIYFEKGMKTARVVVGSADLPTTSDTKIGDFAPIFNFKESLIFFELEDTGTSVLSSSLSPEMKIWTYRDKFIQAEQYTDNVRLHNTAAYNINSKKIIVIESSTTRLILPNNQGLSVLADFVLVHSPSSKLEWEPKSMGEVSVLSLETGETKLLRSNTFHDLSYAPFGRFVLLYNMESEAIACFDWKNATVVNISDGVDESIAYPFPLPVPGRTTAEPLGIAAWLPATSEVLIYGQFDIWRLSLVNKHSPVNQSQFFGRNHSVKLRSVEATQILRPSDSMILTGFNPYTKLHGLYRLFSCDTRQPVKVLVELNNLIYRTGSQVVIHDSFDFLGGMIPKKSENQDIWLLKLQDATHSPNYFTTKDFGPLQQLTNLNLQTSYNWLQAELVTYDQLDGTASQGVLYKPENFDSNKRYPIIFNVYESKSQRFNDFPVPMLSSGDLNPAWYVSRGYLFFTPDIHYELAIVNGRVVGDLAINSVVGAAQYLKTRSYIDSNAMGIHGHSFGGGEALYVISHTKLFSAAVAAASTVSNQLSAYLGVARPDGTVLKENRLLHSEIGHDMIGTDLWSRKDLYLKASPILRADEVRTPLLLMHNQQDPTDWGQSIEMFMALRRLQKPVWMLQYYHSGHQLLSRDLQYDYTVKVTAFFDHYLKKLPPTQWMVSPCRHASPSPNCIFSGMSCHPGCEICHPEMRDLDR